MMGLLKSILGAFSNAAKDEVSRIIESGSDEDLEHAYEKRRLEWLANGQNGTGEKTDDMKRLDREMSRRAAEKWETIRAEIGIQTIDGPMPIVGIRTKGHLA